MEDLSKLGFMKLKRRLVELGVPKSKGKPTLLHLHRKWAEQQANPPANAPAPAKSGDEPEVPAELPGPPKPEERALSAQLEANLTAVAAQIDLPRHYLDDVNADPALEGVANMEQLHARLQQLSEAITDPDGSDWKQLTFSGEHPYPIFRGHNRWKHKGMDGGFKLITQYYRYAVKNERQVKEALEYLAAGAPSQILPAAGARGGLFHGGFKCLLDDKELAKNNIKLIVNTAMGVGQYVRHWARRCDQIEQAGIRLIHLDWQDCEEQELHQDQLLDAIRSIDQAIESGGGALVNCMQGKSRSSAVVCSYIAAKQGVRIREALELVKQGRAQAQPNNSFMRQLEAYERAGFFKSALN